MSRVGRMPVAVPPGVDVRVEEGLVRARGPLGELELKLPPAVRVVLQEGVLRVERESDARRHRAFHGLTRALVANLVKGVSEGFSKTLEIHGVGYRAALQGQDLQLQVGYSHPVTVSPPPGITFEVPQPNRIVVRGASKELVGQVAADIRSVRPPEPYKGKGIRYEGEQIRRKVGKAGK